MNNMIDRLKIHNCGGVILSGGSGEQAHHYCDKCHAFSYDLDDDVPSGVDQVANKEAWDNGEEESPWA